jgi:L-threonylcarbamoyladenylate synthase
MTEIYRVASPQSAPEAIARAAEVLLGGGLVAFPTETVYGLGANALDAAAVGRIFAAKGRPANNPMIVHVAHPEEARDLVTDWSGEAAELAAHFWPGPLTLVLRKQSMVPDMVTAGAATVAVRVPANDVALALLDAAGVPVAAPSANRSNQVSPTTVEHVLKGLGAHVQIVLDGGPTATGLESTVLDLTTDPPRLLRPGMVTPAEIEALIGPISRPAESIADTERPLPSPGMQSRHYAPRAAVECYTPYGVHQVNALVEQGIRVGWLKLGNNAESAPGGAKVIAMECDPCVYAARLYAALHALDDAGVERIIVDLPPDNEEWLAVRDRLRRAATTFSSAPT